jgi:hypothetical protein
MHPEFKTAEQKLLDFACVTGGESLLEGLVSVWDQLAPHRPLQSSLIGTSEIQSATFHPIVVRSTPVCIHDA